MLVFSHSYNFTARILLCAFACFSYPLSAADEQQTPLEQNEVTPQPPVIDKPVAPKYEPQVTDLKSETVKPETVKPDTSNEITTTGKAASRKKTQQKTRWTDTRPDRISADWLQLVSGEWLRGYIIVMQKDTLEFDSDKLDELVIKWKDVKYIKSFEPYSLRFDEQVLVAGTIEVHEDKVHVITDYDEQVFNRSELLTIASGKETELSLWKSKITLSLNVRKGNTRQTDFTSKINAKRRTTGSRLALDYLGNFTSVETVKTVNNHRFNATYDYFITRNLFWTPVTAEYFHDPFQNLDQRLTVGTGLGYSIINTDITEWSVSAGPAYQQTKYESVQAGNSTKDSAFTFILSTKFETEINSKVDIEGSYSATLGDDNTGNYTHHSIFTIETELTDRFDFDVSAVWDRVRSPVADENGAIPDKDDFRLMVGIGYEL